MEIVLLEDVKALGKKGQVVKVNDGYARNFILPKKLGVEATAKNLNDLKLQKAMMRKLQQSSWQRLRSWERRLKSPRWLFRSRQEKAEEPLALFLPRKLPRQQPISWGWILIRRRSF